jgi:hypothetical protein
MTKAIYPSRDTVPLAYTFSICLFNLHSPLRLTVSMHLLETVLIINCTTISIYSHREEIIQKKFHLLLNLTVVTL